MNAKLFKQLCVRFFMEKIKQKMQAQFKLAEEFLDLKTVNTNIIIEQLEHNIKMREMPFEAQLKKRLIKF